MEKGTVWELPTGKFQAGTSKLFNSLGKRGAQVVIQLDEDPNFCTRVASLMLDGAHRVSSSNWELALEIMGEDNVWLPTDWCRFFGYRLTDAQLQEAREIPWSRETLKRLKKDFFLFYALPFTPNGSPLVACIWNWALKQSCVYLGPWVDGQNFSAIRRDTISGWQLVRKEIIPGSIEKDYREQCQLLSPEEEPPSTIQEVMKSALLFTKSGQRANKRVRSRTKDLFRFGGEDRPSRCITVGSWIEDKKVPEWNITIWWVDIKQPYYETRRDYSRRKNLGMGSALKQPA